MKQNLIVFYGTSFIEYNGEYYCNGSFGRFIDLLSNNYQKIKLVVPLSYETTTENVNNYKIKSKNIEIQKLPAFNSYIDAMKKSFKIKNTLKNYSENWHGKIYIRHPNPFTKYVYKLAKSKQMDIYLHLVGDTKNVVREGTKYKGAIKKLALANIEKQDRDIMKIIKNTPTLINGNGLRRLYDRQNNNIKEIRTSTFFKNEIIKKIPTINKKQIKLLYVGYLRHEKGIEYLLKAINLLRNSYNIKLTIIGDGPISEKLKTLSHNLKIQDIVDFKGHLPLGPELFSIYRNNDIFVLPSISEGTPRVLLEAMSNGLPIVATNAGGIPFTIKNRYNGLLIPPKSSKDIVKATTEIIENQELSRKLISNGIEFAKHNSLENHIEEVSLFINNN